MSLLDMIARGPTIALWHPQQMYREMILCSTFTASEIIDWEACIENLTFETKQRLLKLKSDNIILQNGCGRTSVNLRKTYRNAAPLGLFEHVWDGTQFRPGFSGVDHCNSYKNKNIICIFLIRMKFFCLLVSDSSQFYYNFITIALKFLNCFNLHISVE